MVTEEHAGHERGMARRKAGIGGDLPSRRKAVGMEDYQRPTGKRITELANSLGLMAGCAVHRNQVLAWLRSYVES